MAGNRSSAGRRSTARLRGHAGGMFASLVLLRWMSGITLGSGSPALWVWLAAPLALAGVALWRASCPRAER